MYCVNENQDAYPHFAFFIQFFILSFCHTYLFNTYGLFSVKDVSATTSVKILKFDAKLDSDELFLFNKKQPHIVFQSLYLLIFLPLK